MQSKVSSKLLCSKMSILGQREVMRQRRRSDVSSHDSRSLGRSGGDVVAARKAPEEGWMRGEAREGGKERRGHATSTGSGCHTAEATAATAAAERRCDGCSGGCVAAVAAASLGSPPEEEWVSCGEARREGRGEERTSSPQGAGQQLSIPRCRQRRYTEHQ